MKWLVFFVMWIITSIMALMPFVIMNVFEIQFIEMPNTYNPFKILFNLFETMFINWQSTLIVAVFGLLSFVTVSLVFKKKEIPPPKKLEE